jgi:ribosome production factor 1
MLVINEERSRKKVDGITLIHLPSGPSCRFRVSSVQTCKTISGHGNATSHFPELILNNFTTRLGVRVSRFFHCLLPKQPEFQGRQVVTLHNQRDFIFFRRHRYVFRDGKDIRKMRINCSGKSRFTRTWTTIYYEIVMD